MIYLYCCLEWIECKSIGGVVSLCLTFHASGQGSNPLVVHEIFLCQFN